MGFFNEFLKGYRCTPRQECKFRYAPEQYEDRNHRWSNQDSLEGVPAVSFFGEQENYPDAIEHSCSPGSPSPLHGSISARNRTVEATGIKEQSSDREKSFSQNRGSATIANSPIFSGSTSNVFSFEQTSHLSQQNEVENEGEWMYQLNVLAREHAQRKRQDKAKE